MKAIRPYISIIMIVALAIGFGTYTAYSFFDTLRPEYISRSDALIMSAVYFVGIALFKSDVS